MRYIVPVNSQRVLMTQDQLDMFMRIMSDTQRIESRYIKSTNGGASTYVDIIANYNVMADLPINVCMDDDYNALKLFTSAQTSV